MVDWLVKAKNAERPTPDHAACEECGWEGKPVDCKTGWDQESWETPQYEVAFCPDCGENAVDFYSFKDKDKGEAK
jgi:hypothetical protein